MAFGEYDEDTQPRVVGPEGTLPSMFSYMGQS